LFGAGRLKDLGVGTVDTFYTKGKNMGAVMNAGHFEARMVLKRGDDFLGCGDGLGVALLKAFEVMKSYGSEGPHLAEPIAEHKEIIKEALGAGEDGAARRVEVLYIET
jgi:hypothetical protein